MTERKPLARAGAGREPRAVAGTVRRATVDDAKTLGEVHVRAWQGAYRGLMPDTYLDGLDAGERAASWERWLREPPPGETTLVVEDAGEVVGFAHVGPDREGDDPAVGELWAINLDPDRWRKGLGRELLEAASVELRRCGYREAVLWVIDENERARGFYEANGWLFDDATKGREIAGATVTEVRYRRPLS